VNRGRTLSSALAARLVTTFHAGAQTPPVMPDTPVPAPRAGRPVTDRERLLGGPDGDRFRQRRVGTGLLGIAGVRQSKLAQILFTFDVADALAERGISVNAPHSAALMDTDSVREAGVRPRASVEEGRDAVPRLVLREAVRTGGYFEGTEPARAHPQAYDATARARLRPLGERLLGG